MIQTEQVIDRTHQKAAVAVARKATARMRRKVSADSAQPTTAGGSRAFTARQKGL
jgi:hypothetical protein